MDFINRFQKYDPHTKGEHRVSGALQRLQVQIKNNQRLFENTMSDIREQTRNNTVHKKKLIEYLEKFCADSHGTKINFDELEEVINGVYKKDENIKHYEDVQSYLTNTAHSPQRDDGKTQTPLSRKSQSPGKSATFSAKGRDRVIEEILKWDDDNAHGKTNAAVTTLFKSGKSSHAKSLNRDQFKKNMKTNLNLDVTVKEVDQIFKQAKITTYGSINEEKLKTVKLQ